MAKLKPAKPVKGYEGLYSVDDTGTVYGWKGQPLKPHDNGYGYLIVDLHDLSGEKKHKKVHRLVAEAFIPNPKTFQRLTIKTRTSIIILFQILNGAPQVTTKDMGQEEKAAQKG